MANRDIWDEIEMVGKGEHLDEEMFEYLSAYADGECTAKERRLVEAYLAENAEARAQLADLRMQAALASEAGAEPPEWLRGAILAKTVDRPSLRWPFAASLGTLAAGAAALALYLANPNNATPTTDRLLANVVAPEVTLDTPDIVLPDVPEAATIEEEIPLATEDRLAAPAEAPPSRARSSVTLASRSHADQRSPVQPETQAVPQQPSSPIEEAEDDATYAVVEYGGGKFEAKQPQVFDAEPSSAEPNRPSASQSPAVLPDAREKLRDKVRKMNEEKLEIEGTE